MTTKADTAAADRLLKAAVREATALLAAAERGARDDARFVLHTAGLAAALLLGERAA